MFKTLLVCSDGSEAALKAAQKAAEIAKQADACVLLLHVADEGPPATPYAVPWQMISGAAESHHLAMQEALLADTAQVFQKAGVRCQLLCEKGHPAPQIVHVAERDGVDLIVMGSRGLSVLKSLLLGSVSDYVIHHAHCSVLIIR